MTGIKALGVFAALCLASTFCSASELARLVLEGHELHDSLVTREFNQDSIRHIPISVLGGNPYLSDDSKFIKAVSRGGSQGRLEGEGVRSALFGIYAAEKDLGIYGLEAESEAAADLRENAIREIWAHNMRLDRARIHREGLVLVVVWHDGVSPECWEAANSVIAGRLAVP